MIQDSFFFAFTPQNPRLLSTPLLLTPFLGGTLSFSPFLGRTLVFSPAMAAVFRGLPWPQEKVCFSKSCISWVSPKTRYLSFWDGRLCAPTTHGGSRLLMSYRSNFFDREHELEELKAALSKPGSFLILTGPPNSGKSTLLKELVERLPDVKGERSTVVIDMRMGKMHTAQALRAHLIGNVEVTSGTELDVNLLGLVKFKVSAQQLLAQNSADGLIPVLQGFMAKNEQEHVPTIIIDEANRLHSWSTSQEENGNLSALMDYFVAITKQQRKANVILGTSEDFFREWLEDKYVGKGRLKTLVLGDLPELLALEFFRTVCPDIQDALWQDIWETFGGRMYDLEELANYLDRFQNDESKMVEVFKSYRRKALAQAKSELLRACSTTLHPRFKPVAWTRTQLAKVFRFLAEADFGVMSLQKLRKKLLSEFELGERGCDELLDSLIIYNILHYRVDDPLFSRDMGWYNGDYPVVMPPSRVYWQAMKQMDMD